MFKIMVPKSFIHFFVFFNGLAITGLEMTASKYLAPYFGTSTLIWANIIGVILTALALGYSLGGKVSAKNPKPELFYKIGLAGVFLSILMPILASILFKFGLFTNQADFFGSIVGSLIVALFAFGLPVFFLAMLSPFAVRIVSDDINQVGNSAGSLYSLSTVGSVVGIYVSTFITVPYLGVSNTFNLMGFIVIALSLIGLGFKPNLKNIGISLVTSLGVLGLSLYSLTVQGQDTLFSKDGLYQKVEIKKFENLKLLSFNEGKGVQSAYDPESPIVNLGLQDTEKLKWYTNYYMFLPALSQFKDKPKLDVLVLGYAGGGAGQTLRYAGQKINKQIVVEGVEIDPLVVEVSQKYLGINDTDRKINIEDARSFVNNASKTNKQYDIIILDTYSSRLSIPSHLLTTEFLQVLKS
jgi:predicted membrane-bound spermidine synthase